MKPLAVLFCCLLPLPTMADIIPPPPNFSLSGNNVIDAQGQINDDPKQVVRLTSAEMSSVKVKVAQVNDNLKQSQIKRRDGAIARSKRNPRLIK